MQNKTNTSYLKNNMLFKHQTHATKEMTFERFKDPNDRWHSAIYAWKTLVPYQWQLISNSLFSPIRLTTRLRESEIVL